jgi:phosphoserine phosphatase RsbU/P
MSMVKSAVLQPLTSPNVYATFAYIAGDGDSQLRFSLAGHLPIFHLQFAKRHAQLCRVENLPLGMFADARYQTATIECRPGDLLAMITDGLTEVFDREGRELGWKHLENTLADCAGEPLPEIASRIIRTSEAFGPITDDRTLLLVRYLGTA